MWPVLGSQWEEESRGLLAMSDVGDHSWSWPAARGVGARGRSTAEYDSGENGDGGRAADGCARKNPSSLGSMSQQHNSTIRQQIDTAKQVGNEKEKYKEDGSSSSQVNNTRLASPNKLADRRSQTATTASLVHVMHTRLRQ